MFCSESTIEGVKFYPRGGDENREDSFVEVVHKDLYSGGIAAPGGPNDLFMGTTDFETRCRTCLNIKKFCPGHPGHIELNFPVPSPIFLSDIKSWLKITCFICSSLVIRKMATNVPRRNVLKETVALNNSYKNMECPKCGTIHPFITDDPNDQIQLLARYYSTDKEEITKEIKIYADEIYDIFDRIRDSDVRLMGKDPTLAHPRNFIWWTLQVGPNTIRPQNKSIGGGRRKTSDLTQLIINIIQYNNQLPEQIPDDLSSIDPKISNLNLLVYEMVKGSTTTDKRKIANAGNRQHVSLAGRMKTKYGRIRRNLMGSRSNSMARSFITGDPALEIDEVGVPQIVAQNIQYPEVVRSFNKARLMVHFRNGRDRYPGCTKIIEADTGRVRSIEHISEEYELKYGDVIKRDIIEGDYVGFNRAPSLLPSNISGMRVKVITHGLTFRINVQVCALFNADFDGDAMNLLFPQSIATVNEIKNLSGVRQRFISEQRSQPMIGNFQDALVGMAEFTREDVLIDKYHAMQIYSNVKYYPKFDKKTYTGRDLVSILMEAKAPISFERKPKFYDDSYNIKYAPSDIKVNIVRGKHLSGILDKASVGQSAKGGIFHIIHNEYGAKMALKMAFWFQQMAQSFMLMRGSSIGIGDIIVDRKFIPRIHQAVARVLYRSQTIIDKLNAEEIVPPFGKTLDQYYEEQQLIALEHGDDFLDILFDAIEPYNNNFYKFVSYGSKGNLGNFLNSISAIGQITVAGERAEMNYGFHRSLIYFTRDETSPISRGYIANPYIAGLNLVEFIFHCMDARYALIQKGLSVATVGGLNREGIKNLESTIVDNMRHAEKAGKIMQLVYGEDNLDPRFVEEVKFPTVMISEKDFKEKYDMSGKFKSGKAELKAEFEQLAEDRQFYRDLFMFVERNASKELISNKKHMPVNIHRIIRNTVNKMGLRSVKKVKINPVKSIMMVRKLCDDLPYIMSNHIQREKQAPKPDHIVASVYLMTILIRSHLCVANLIKNKINETALKIIIDAIWATYERALCDYGTAVGIFAAQSVSEPMTQMVLDSHHRSGGAGSKTTGIDRLRAIFGAADTSDPDKGMLPTMSLIPREDIREDKEAVQKIANHIEMISFSLFVTECQIFFESFGKPVHPDFANEAKMIRYFTQNNPVSKPPSDLSKWCIRFEISKEKLIFKHISLETIYRKLREIHPRIYIVYNAENADTVIMRIYMRNTIFKRSGEIVFDDVLKFKNLVLDSVVRGVDHIRSAEVVSTVRSYVDDDGAIKSKKIFSIVTSGSNISRMLEIPELEPKDIMTDNIREVEYFYGIEAARYKIIQELKENIKGVNYRHYSIYADEMTYTGRVTSIRRSGLKKREPRAVMLQTSYQAPLDVLHKAAVNAQYDKLSAISANLMLGKPIKVGTSYNEMVLDEEFIKSNVKSVEEILDVFRS